MVPVYKWSVVYNEMDNVISDRRYSYYMQTNNWVETTWEYTYNDRGGLLAADHYFKSSEIADKIKISRLEQNYDEYNSRILREMYSRHRDDIWIGLEKTEWGYDSEGRKTRELAYSWVKVEYKWSLKRKSEYSIDDADQVRTEMIYAFNEDIDAWILNRQIEYTYDLQGNRVSKSCSEYDSAYEKWTGVYRFDYIFDDEGREISSIQYDWDSSLNIWIPVWNRRMGYGSAVYLASFHWSADHNDWILYSKTFYNYRKGFVTGIPDEEQDNIVIYPNPARSILKIDGIEDQLTINIYSITGNLMLLEDKPETRFDISILSNGIYIIVIQQAGKILLTKKVVKH
jgi:hypothetical protein